MTKIRSVLVFCLVLASFAALIYWGSLHGNYFFDDGPSILLVKGIQINSLAPDALLQAWSSGGSGPTGRPIAQLSFALNYFFSGFDPFVFKATNLVIHLINGLWVFAIARLLLSAAQPLATPRHLLMASGWVAALWLLHPIQLLPVLHVVQRMTSLSALFLLAAFWLHIRARTCGGGQGFPKAFSCSGPHGCCFGRSHF